MRIRGVEFPISESVTDGQVVHAPLWAYGLRSNERPLEKPFLNPPTESGHPRFVVRCTNGPSSSAIRLRF
jgi:hypothetical protein